MPSEYNLTYAPDKFSFYYHSKLYNETCDLTSQNFHFHNHLPGEYINSGLVTNVAIRSVQLLITFYQRIGLILVEKDEEPENCVFKLIYKMSKVSLWLQENGIIISFEIVG